MAAPMSVFRRLPIVVILGATGTGKSKLAIQIGARFGGEIISADSMQVFKGLNIITNKVTADEQQACPHHLIDFLNPLSRYTVVDFRNKALPVIEGLLKENRIPVIVGGTNYYIEALLWRVLLDTEHSETEDLLLQARGDPVNLSIRRKRRCPHAEPVASKVPHLSGVKLGPSKIGGKPPSVTAQKSVRTSDAEAQVESSSSVCEFSECGGKPALGLSEPESEESEDVSKLAANVHHSQQDTGADCQSSRKNCQENSSAVADRPEQTVCRMDVSELPKDSSRRVADDSPEHEEMMTIDVEETETGDLYQILAEVDPCRADTLHPNNRRKIIRSLQVYEQLGRTHSEVLSSQMEEQGGGPLGGPLRFKDVCILWLQCDRDVLDKRLDDRVDAMLSRGLLKELADFHLEYNRQRVESHAESESLYTQGIFQSIGFKEFHPYLVLPEGDRESDEGRSLLQEGVEKLKLATRQYARRQNRWVKNRFVRRPGSNVPPVYAVNATDPTLWNENVLQPALAILGAMVEGKEPPVVPLEVEGGNPSKEAAARHVCDVCDGRVFVGHQQWLEHLKSKRHYKKARKLRLVSLVKSYEEKMPSTTETTVPQGRQEEFKLDVEDR